jgi:hypothetical protein
MGWYLFITVDVGPITHAFTYGEDALDELAAMRLEEFEARVRGLFASGGGDYPEYALAAMLAAMDYSSIDEYGEMFTPMSYGSELVVITDATSLQEELEDMVVDKAKAQGVSIHFILSDHDYLGFRTYSVYNNIADKTEGTVYRNIHSTWSILKFFDELSGSTDKRRKRSEVAELTIDVSIFTHFLRVSTLTRHLHTGTVNITKPDGTLETADITSNVMIYIDAHPLPGMYRFGVQPDEHLVRQDTILDLSLFYLNSNYTTSSPNPLPGCEYLLDWL